MQQPLESHRLRHRRIVEENRDLSPGGQAHRIRPRGIHPTTVHVLPILSVLAQQPDGTGLEGREDREPDAVGGQDLEGLQVHGALGQPHPLGGTPEPRLEITQTPPHLGDLVTGMRQRHDHVVVTLGQRGAMARETLPALLIGLDNGR